MTIFHLILLASLTANVYADGFSYSAGWKPGQTVASQQPTPVGWKPGQQVTSQQPAPTESIASSGRPFSWTSLLTSGPLNSLFARAGINITQKLEEAQQKATLPWDARIPMITDNNFEELILNETFSTREEEESRIWLLLITITASQRTGISPLIDAQFNEAYNITVYEQDLPHVRWGRIDYLNVTRLTTKWAVWRPPMLIVAKDRGQSLRFFYPQQIGSKGFQLHEFLLKERWLRTKPWSGPWAPGGSREGLLDKFAICQEILYYYMVKVPRWMYLVISGGLGSFLIQVLHRRPRDERTSTTQHAQSTQPATGSEAGKDAVNPADSPAREVKQIGPHKRKKGKK